MNNNWLIRLDRSAFYIVNKKWALPELDSVMLLLREAYTWVPLYLFFMLFFYSNCRRFFLPLVLLSIVTFAITDFTSASVIKPLVQRLRPCHDPYLGFELNNISGCGGLFSMPSSHASNHFGLATFWFIVINHLLGHKWYWLFLWAFAICYAQVYVGVHYPGDVLAGALLGAVVGSLTGNYFIKFRASVPPPDESPVTTSI